MVCRLSKKKRSPTEADGSEIFSKRGTYSVFPKYSSNVIPASVIFFAAFLPTYR